MFPLAPPPDTPARDETYGKRVSDFQQHAKKMADTAAALAKSGVVTDRVLADDLIRTSGKVGVVSRTTCSSRLSILFLRLSSLLTSPFISQHFFISPSSLTPSHPHTVTTTHPYNVTPSYHRTITPSHHHRSRLLPHKSYTPPRWPLRTQTMR